MTKNKLIVTIPSNNVKERRYTCDVLLGELLCVDYEIKVGGAIDNTIIEVDNRKVIIEDHFFNNYPKELSYLNKKNIPVECGTFYKTNGKTVPIIFGTDKLIISEQQVICGLDLIASSYFMLSRWEEFVQGRQETGKCDEQLLFAVRNNLCFVPIVHLYEELLSELIYGLDNRPKIERKFSIKPTHDVDRCYLTGWGELLSNAKRMYKGGAKKKARKLVLDYMWYKIHEPDPFNTYDFFCSCADASNIKDSFFFKCCEMNERGYTYSIDEDRVKSEFDIPIKSGHVIGFHPSESTFNNTEQFKTELNRLEKATGIKTVCGRNHGLYCNTTTYKQWEEAKAEYVSNYGYQHRFGFRCGIAVPFSLFDVFEQRKLQLKELPFIVMDTVMYRNNPETEDAIKEIKDIVDDIKYFNAVLCLNWHTNVYNMPDMRKYRKVSKFIFDYAKN